MDNMRRLEQIENTPRNQHCLRDRSNPLEHLEDHEFQARFRFSKDTVRSTIDIIRDDLSTFCGKASNAAAVSRFTIFATGCW